MKMSLPVIPVSRTGRSRARWEYLKALAPALPRYVHISCHATMRPNPLDPLLPWIPFVEKGTTFNAGRNQDKRAKRAAAKVARGSLPPHSKIVVRPLTRKALNV